MTAGSSVHAPPHSARSGTIWGGAGARLRERVAAPAALAVAAAGVSFVVWLGWLLDLRVLRSFANDYPSLKPNGALAFFAIAVAVVAHRNRRVAAASVAFASAVGFTTIMQYVLGVDMRIDQLFFEDRDLVTGLQAGRPSINAASGIVALCLALEVARSTSRRSVIASQALTFCALAVGTLGVFGYLAGIERLYGFDGFPPLSLPGALVLSLLACAVLALHADDGSMRVLRGETVSARLARRLLPLALLAAPIALTLRTQAVDHGLMTSSVADWLLAFGETAVLGAAVFVTVNASRSLETRLEETERARRQGELLFHRFVDNVPDNFLAYLTPDGVHEIFSGATERIYGYTPEELVGTDAAFLRVDGADMAAELAEALETGRFEAETRRRRKDGSTIWVHLVITPLLDESGVHLGFVKVGRDVSEEKRAREQLQVLTDDLTQSNRELEEFAYVASHDLSAPLRAIAGYLDLIERRYRDDLPQDAQQFMARAALASVRMQQMIDDLLTYSRASRRPLARERVDLTELVADVLEILAPAVNEAGATFEVADLPPVFGDRMQLCQLLQNLLANAIKFRGDDPPRVTIGATRCGATWRFDVADNGIGVDAGHVPELFKMFHRLNGERFPGSGIGLAVCSRIVDRHGGEITHAPSPSGGSIFSFTLPAEE